jgi:hypothetical protein
VLGSRSGKSREVLERTAVMNDLAVCTVNQVTSSVPFSLTVKDLSTQEPVVLSHIKDIEHFAERLPKEQRSGWTVELYTQLLMTYGHVEYFLEELRTLVHTKEYISEEDKKLSVVVEFEAAVEDIVKKRDRPREAYRGALTLLGQTDRGKGVVELFASYSSREDEIGHTTWAAFKKTFKAAKEDLRTTILAINDAYLDRLDNYNPTITTSSERVRVQRQDISGAIDKLKTASADVGPYTARVPSEEMKTKWQFGYHSCGLFWGGGRYLPSFPAREEDVDLSIMATAVLGEGESFELGAGEKEPEESDKSEQTPTPIPKKKATEKTGFRIDKSQCLCNLPADLKEMIGRFCVLTETKRLEGIKDVVANQQRGIRACFVCLSKIFEGMHLKILSQKQYSNLNDYLTAMINLLELVSDSLAVHGAVKTLRDPDLGKLFKPISSHREIVFPGPKKVFKYTHVAIPEDSNETQVMDIAPEKTSFEEDDFYVEDGSVFDSRDVWARLHPIFTEEVRMYLWHAADSLPEGGPLHNMMFSIAQQLCRQNPFYYLRQVQLRDDHSKDLIAYPTPAIYYPSNRNLNSAFIQHDFVGGQGIVSGTILQEVVVLGELDLSYRKNSLNASRRFLARHGLNSHTYLTGSHAVGQEQLDDLSAVLESSAKKGDLMRNYSVKAGAVTWVKNGGLRAHRLDKSSKKQKSGPVLVVSDGLVAPRENLPGVLEVLPLVSIEEISLSHQTLTPPSRLRFSDGVAREMARFPVEVSLEGLGPLSDALVGRLSWRDPRVVDARDKLLYGDGDQATKFMESWNELAVTACTEAFDRVKTREMEMFGNCSFFHCLKGAGSYGTLMAEAKRAEKKAAAHDELVEISLDEFYHSNQTRPVIASTPDPVESASTRQEDPIEGASAAENSMETESSVPNLAELAEALTNDPALALDTFDDLIPESNDEVDSVVQEAIIPKTPKKRQAHDDGGVADAPTKKARLSSSASNPKAQSGSVGDIYDVPGDDEPPVLGQGTS